MPFDLWDSFWLQSSHFNYFFLRHPIFFRPLVVKEGTGKKVWQKREKTFFIGFFFSSQHSSSFLCRKIIKPINVSWLKVGGIAVSRTTDVLAANARHINIKAWRKIERELKYFWVFFLIFKFSVYLRHIN